jgi:hypothetical protein
LFGEHNKKVTTVHHVALLPPMLHYLCKMGTTSSMLSKSLCKEASE